MAPTKWKKTPFPEKLESSNVPSVQSAYNLCYQEQQRLTRLGLKGDSDALMRIRVVGWMFHFATEDRMLVELSRSVISCSGDGQKYNDLGQFFIDFWIRTCDSHPSRTSFETVVDQVAKQLQPYPQNHSTAKKNALIRDGFRCSLSHRYDLSTYTKEHGDSEASRPRFDYGKGSGYISSRISLRSADSYHEMVDTLALWFDPVDDNENTHKYKVGANIDIVYREVPTIVTFTNSTPSGQAPLPMPSKRYLRLHAACAKVANMSAAARYLDNFDKEQEEHEASVLAEDGSSASFLEQCLHLVSLSHFPA
ncbi:hypothetical protein C8J56DRAFT_979669 [Mycena floridula]|nr:hypothetical protein C8J56DRAFT_979669 [Mycena floridula]